MKKDCWRKFDVKGKGSIDAKTSGKQRKKV